MLAVVWLTAGGAFAGAALGLLSLPRLLRLLPGWDSAAATCGCPSLPHDGF